MFTKQDLVNNCLMAIGNERISTLDHPDTDTDIAITLVEETLVEVLATGWWFNTEDNWKFQPDFEGQISLPSTTISFRPSGLSSGLELVKRNGMLWDKTNKTFDMRGIVDNEGNITLDILIILEVSDIPINGYNFIKQVARTKFILDIEGDKLRVEKNENKILPYLAALEKEHYRNSSFNVYEHQGVANVLSGMVSQNSFAGMGVGSGSPLGGGSDV